MLQNGLEEAMDVFDKIPGEKDFTKGILQAIGYKEFYKYYLQRDDQTLKECKESLCVATLRYAKYQNKWLNKRIKANFRDQDPHILLEICLNNKDQYEEIAKSQSIDHVNRILNFYRNEL